MTYKSAPTEDTLIQQAEYHKTGPRGVQIAYAE